MISPALGGIIIDQWGITAALILSLLFYIPSLSVLAFLKPREIKRSKAKESFRTALTNGFEYLWQRSDLRLIMLMTAVMSLSIRGTAEILPVVADGVFNKGPTGLGHLASAVGAGAVIASILKTFAPVQTSSALSLPSILCAAIGILSVALFGNSDVWIMTLFAAALLGACSTYLGVSLQSAVQTGLPDDMRGRVMSIWIVTSTGASALGAFLIGIATETLGLGNSATLMTLFCLSTCIYLFIRTKKEGG
jgi:predicted MFS family arabinose efflux permease